MLKIVEKMKEWTEDKQPQGKSNNKQAAFKRDNFKKNIEELSV